MRRVCVRPQAFAQGLGEFQSLCELSKLWAGDAGFWHKKTMKENLAGCRRLVMIREKKRVTVWCLNVLQGPRDLGVVPQPAALCWAFRKRAQWDEVRPVRGGALEKGYWGHSPSSLGCCSWPTWASISVSPNTLCHLALPLVQKQWRQLLRFYGLKSPK